MNSRVKRKLRVLADSSTEITEKGQARIDSLDEVVAGKLVRANQKKYFDKLMKV